MPIITATEVTTFSDISASAAEINASGLIAIVQDRITWICNNYFLTDLYLQQSVTFNAAARTITGSNSYETAGFADGDEIHIYRSYRNEGYHETSTVTSGVITLASSESVIAELSGRSVLISVVAWPSDLKYTAAQMIEYDYDKRKGRTPGVTSVRLGPWSESYDKGGSGEFGYPSDILAPLYDHRVARIM